MADEAFNPYPLLKAAAFGDAEAMRQLSRAAFAVGMQERNFVAINEALIFGRLAYARTHDPADAGSVVSMLASAEHLVGPDEVELLTMLQSESIAHIAILADEGEDLAADNLERIVSDCLPAAAAAASDLREMMKGY